MSTTSTDAVIAERHDPMFVSCVAHVTGSDRVKMHRIDCVLPYAPPVYAVEPPYDPKTATWFPTDEQCERMRARLLALNAAQDRAAMANAGDEGSRAA